MKSHQQESGLKVLLAEFLFFLVVGEDPLVCLSDLGYRIHLLSEPSVLVAGA